MSLPGLQDVTAVILAGGLGTRLRSVVAHRPKVLAEVNGRPFLAYQLDQLAAVGCQQVILCTGYRAANVEAEFGTTFRTLELRYSAEPEPLGTGGALRLALPKIQTNMALVLNGDSYADADLLEFYRSHLEARVPASLLLVWAEDTGRFGRVDLSPTGKISAFTEKQPAGPAGWINAGIYLLPRALLATIPAGRPVSLERECFPAWLNLPMAGIARRIPFLDIGTPTSYGQAEEFFNRQREVSELEAAGRPANWPLVENTARQITLAL